MSINDFVLVQGMRDTRGTLEEWQREPAPVIREWVVRAMLIAIALLFGVWVAASLMTPDPTTIQIVGLQNKATAGDIAHTLMRNSLVLAFHATACVAGFIAGSSIPLSAQQRTGFSAKLHTHAGKVAIGIVVAVTAFSLFNQIYYLGGIGASLSAQLHISPGLLVLTLLPHAIPELTALFLPLAAWLIASRRGEWNELLAATAVTVAIAIPVLITCAIVEAFLWPVLLRAASPVA